MTKSPLTSEFIAYVRSFNTDVANAIEALEAENAGFLEQLALRSESNMHKDMQEIMRINNQLNARIAELETENVKLREALVKLNAAVDAFWNDPDRPSIAKMKSNSVYDVIEAQFRARTALGESDG